MRCLPTVFGVWYNQGNALLYPFFVKYVLEEEGGLSLSFGNQTRKIIPARFSQICFNFSSSQNPIHPSNSKIIRRIHPQLTEVYFGKLTHFWKTKRKQTNTPTEKTSPRNPQVESSKKYPFNLKWNLPPRIDSSWGFWVFIFCWVDSSCPFGPWPQNVSINDIPWRLLPVSSALEQIPKSMCFGRFCQQGKWTIWHFYHDDLFIFIIIIHHHQKNQSIHDFSIFGWLLHWKQNGQLHQKHRGLLPCW